MVSHWRARVCVYVCVYVGVRVCVYVCVYVGVRGCVYVCPPHSYACPYQVVHTAVDVITTLVECHDVPELEEGLGTSMTSRRRAIQQASTASSTEEEKGTDEPNTVTSTPARTRKPRLRLVDLIHAQLRDASFPATAKMQALLAWALNHQSSNGNGQ